MFQPFGGGRKIGSGLLWVVSLRSSGGIAHRILIFTFFGRGRGVMNHACVSDENLKMKRSLSPKSI
jgi:hypothetical protein